MPASFKSLSELLERVEATKKWLKIKTVLESLDLVITAAEYGYGRRKGRLSDYYLGQEIPRRGTF